MLLSSKYKMTYSIKDYLSDIPLTLGDRVQLSLLAENQGEEGEVVERGIRPINFKFSLEVTVNGTKYNSIPIATAIKSTPRILAYGRKEKELQQIGKEVCTLGYSRGAILEPFFEIPTLGLERAMSSDSIVYIFRGIMDYAQVVSQKVTKGTNNNIKLGNKDIGSKEITQMLEATSTVFHGYRNLVMEDRKLLNREDIGETPLYSR